MDCLLEVLTPRAHPFLSEQAIRDTVEAVVDKSTQWEALERGTYRWALHIRVGSPT
jgi:hypothetical protein